MWKEYQYEHGYHTLEVGSIRWNFMIDSAHLEHKQDKQFTECEIYKSAEYNNQ